MNRRLKTSGGQAVVLVTLSLFAMAGLMGLAVDLGWSFYVQRQAQSAADAAAIGAVQEAKNRLGTALAGFTCPATPGAGTAWCSGSGSATILGCSSGDAHVVSPSNLYNGCLYASRLGFIDGSTNPPQVVSIRAYDASTLPALPAVASGAHGLGVTNLVYWVTVSTVQTIPQLFSAFLGHTTGTISAISTAAIASTAIPGGFYGMNRAGDCTTLPGTTTPVNCGQDVNIGGGTTITTPADVILASPCTAAGGSGSTKCDGQALSTGGSSCVGAGVSVPGSCTPNTAGGQVLVNGSTATVAGQNFNPAPAVVGDPNLFLDPTRGLPQPPIVASSATGQIPPCGIPNGTISGGTKAAPLILGPYNYYSYTGFTASGTPIPTGVPITITGNVDFSPTGTCAAAGVGAVLAGTHNTITGVAEGNTASSFDSFLFWGGMYVTGSVNYEKGQYVYVGQNPTQTAGLPLPGSVFGNDKGTYTELSSSASINPSCSTCGAGTTGALQVFTAPGDYPGLSTQTAAMDASVPGLTSQLVQGSLDLGKGDGSQMQLYGIQKNSPGTATNLPAVLSDYSGIALWMDRRNSVDYYNPDGTCGTTAPGMCGEIDQIPPQANSTEMGGGAGNQNCPSGNCATSAMAQWGQGNTSIAINGMIYMPRGSYFLALHGNGNGCVNGALTVVTGAYVTPSGNGVCLNLTAPVVPFLVYNDHLIQ